ncbi:MAG: DNA-binding protein [Candidatus Thorarchaeota archaeon]
MTHAVTVIPRRVVVARLEPGDDVLESLQTIARDQDIRGAQLSAIGALSGARVGYFELASRKYREIEINREVEVVSCIGNISRLEDGQTVIHAHMVVSDDEGRCYGGHLMKGCVVSVTLEVVIMEFDKGLLRAHDKRSGLNLLMLKHS